MPAPVELVTIHHEGAGAPRDFPGGDWPYTYWLGVSSWFNIQTVWASWGTLDFNGTSLDVVFSGQRQPGIPNSPAYPVSDRDIALLDGIIGDARARRYVVSDPLVRAHRNSPGSNTVCPGDNTLARWSQIVAACTSSAPPNPIPQPPDWSEPMTTLATGQLSPNKRRATLRPIRGLNVVLGENGGKADGSKQSGDDWTWAPDDPVVEALAPGALIDICKVNASTFAALYDLGNNDIGTYLGTITGGAFV